MAIYQYDFDNLNNEEVSVRLDSLRMLADGIFRGEIPAPHQANDVNNHIHTFYSFSPYSPSKALWMAYLAGLTTAGIMDHDSISGAVEFIEAGKILGMATTIGAECRVDFSHTPFAGKRINNPDQDSIAYMAMHGIPHTQIGRMKAFFASCLIERNKRNALMTDRLNDLFRPFDITLDFESDVKPLSKWREGGSITERHLLFALSCKLTERFGKGQGLVDFLRDKLHIGISGKVEQYLLDSANPFYEYDLLGVLKGNLVERFYLKAKAECPDVREVTALCKEIGAIAAYAYLGDVGNSVTGDKKTQKFEDDFLDELFETITALGFTAVTYMPSRNTTKQLDRIRGLCDRYGLFQISGEDINSPRQKFVCEAMRSPEFGNLVDSTWALIGHEQAATVDLRKGMFSEETVKAFPALEDRIRIYKELGHS